MTYILFVFFATGHGAAVTTAEFLGENTCWKAAQEINNMSKGSLSAFCAKK